MPAGNYYGNLLDSRDIVADFYPRLEATMEQIWAPKISVEVPSDRETEEYGWLGQVPQMRQWIGGRKEVQLGKYSLNIRNVPYEATLPISIDDLRRDKTGQLRQRVADLAVRTATHWNTLLATLISNSEAGSSGLAYDGQFYHDTDHNESGSNQTNDLTVTEIPAADVATTAAPTVTEAAAIITQVIGYSQTYTDDQGELINQGPKHVVIVVTTAVHFASFMNAVTLNNLASNAENPVQSFKASGWTFEVVFSARLTAASTKVKFFFGNPSMGYSPLIRQNEVDVQTELKDERFENRRDIFGVSAVRGAGYGQWQLSILVTLS